MNDLAWDLSDKNEKVGDAHTAKSIAMMDESLALMQRALGLLNSVSIDPEMMVEEKAPAKKASAGLFSRKKADEVSEQDLSRILQNAHLSHRLSRSLATSSPLVS